MEYAWTIYKREVILFVTALVIFLVGFFIFTHITNIHGISFPIHGNDARGYFQLAENIREQGVFSRSSSEPFMPDSFRTPGYPFFIFVIGLLTEQLFVVSLLQGILFASSSVLIYGMSRRYIPHPWNMFPSVLFMVDITGIFLTSVFLSESLFIFLLLLGTYYFLEDNPSWGKTGLVLGMATLVRPIGLLFFLLFGLWGGVDVLTKRKSWEGVQSLSFMIMAFFIFVAPWSIRNYYIFNSWQISDVSTRKLFQYDAPIFNAYKNGVSESEARLALQNQLYEEEQISLRELTFREAGTARKIAIKEIKETPVLFTIFYAIKSTPFFVTDGITDILQELGVIDPIKTNISNAILTGTVKDLSKELRINSFYFLFFLIGSLWWIILMFFMVVGVGGSFKMRHLWRYHLLFLFGIVVIIGFSTGTVANYRFRYPVTPYIFLLAVQGIYISTMAIRHEYASAKK